MEDYNVINISTNKKLLVFSWREEMEPGEMIISPDTKRNNRLPPGQHLTEKWPVLHYGQVPAIQTVSWSFRISGLVDKELTLDYNTFLALPAVRVFSDIHCVTTWSRLNNTWEGISTAAIKQLVNIDGKARFVIVQAKGGFTTNLPAEDFFAEDVLFALKHNDALISADHGGPVRLVVPRLYFWKSAKWVTGIEFTSKDKPGFWESNGYHNHGDPWKEERYG
jgi:DMSO/TMAO reductase YedYZ molybdopterin-dependent catalytic subunit